MFCPNCGTQNPDTSKFCIRCGTALEANPEVQPTQQPIQAYVPQPVPVAYGMNTRSLLITSAIAGGVIALLSSLPVIYLCNCLGCMWLWTGGILGAWLYHRREMPQFVMTAGQGAVVGLVTGVMAAIFVAILGTVMGGAGISSLLASQSRTLGSVFGTTAGSFATAGVLSGFGLLFTIFIYPFFGLIGGVIGAVIFGKPLPKA